MYRVVDLKYSQIFIEKLNVVVVKNMKILFGYFNICFLFNF